MAEDRVQLDLVAHDAGEDEVSVDDREIHVGLAQVDVEDDAAEEPGAVPASLPGAVTPVSTTSPW